MWSSSSKRGSSRHLSGGRRRRLPGSTSRTSIWLLSIEITRMATTILLALTSGTCGTCRRFCMKEPLPTNSGSTSVDSRTGKSMLSQSSSTQLRRPPKSSELTKRWSLFAHSRPSFWENKMTVLSKSYNWPTRRRRSSISRGKIWKKAWTASTDRLLLISSPIISITWCQTTSLTKIQPSVSLMIWMNAPSKS
jgi:hypothetical protein